MADSNPYTNGLYNPLHIVDDQDFEQQFERTLSENKIEMEHAQFEDVYIYMSFSNMEDYPAFSMWY